jgi:hypothetical protein
MVTSILERRIARSLILILVLLQIGFFISVYVSAGVLGQLTYPNFFISNALSLDPGRAIGAFVLPVCATIILLVVGARLFRIYRTIPLSTKFKFRLFWFIFVCLILTVLGMIGVSAIAIQTHRWVHWTVAAIMFISGVFLITSFPFLDKSLQIIAPRWLVRLRWLTASAVAVTAIALAATISWAKVAASVLEITVSALFIVYFVTFAHVSDFPPTSRLEAPSAATGPAKSSAPATRVVARRNNQSRSNSDTFPINL